VLDVAYTYNRNGAIEYNLLNLPQRVTNTMDTTKSVTYSYDSRGGKLRRQAMDGGVVTSTVDYAGNKLYTDGTLSKVLIPGGYINVSGSQASYMFFATDHLGSVRQVLDSNGAQQEQNDYYPFGMQQRRGGYLQTTTNKYKYNGKEQDKFGDFTTLDYGARFYDPALGRFHTIDRFAEKYTSLTPYHYGANNPVYFIDVNGDSLWVTHRTGFLGLGGRQTLLYENGNLYNRDGTAYTGEVKGYLSKVKGALDDINAVSSGQGLLRQLEGSVLNFTVQRGSNKFVPNSVARAGLARVSPAHAVAAGSGGTIYWNPGAKSSGPNQLGNTARPTFLGLTHELGHASMAEQGMSDYSIFSPGHADPNLSRVTNDEFNAVHIENQVRSEYKLLLREFYTRDATGAGFMRFLTPATSTNAITGYDYILNNPMQINYVGPNSGK
jgi:RHS repeat-associated protein